MLNYPPLIPAQAGIQRDEVCIAKSGSPRPQGRAEADASRGAADWLCLAAAPTFAIMAVLTLIGDGGAICAAASPLGGMATMYGLMSAFHLTPWLKLIARRHGSPN